MLNLKEFSKALYPWMFTVKFNEYSGDVEYKRGQHNKQLHHKRMIRPSLFRRITSIEVNKSLNFHKKY